MWRNFFSPYFLITWVALTLAASLFWLGSFRSEGAEVSVLILPKTEMALSAPANVAYFLQSETFRQRFLNTLAHTDSVLRNTPVRELPWQKVVQVELPAGSSILHINVQDSRLGETKQLTTLLVKALAEQLSQWYNVETELDFRIIDGPRVQTSVAFPSLILVSTLTALGVTALFFLLLAFLEYGIERTMTKRREDLSYHISAETFQPKVPKYWPQTEALTPPTAPEMTFSQERDESLAPPMEIYPPEDLFSDPNPAEVISTWEEPLPTASPAELSPEEETPFQPPLSIATGPAPDNLPIADVLSPLEAANARLFKADIDATAELQATQAEVALAQTTPVQTEPTQAEYKRRLNDLLSGKL